MANRKISYTERDFEGIRQDLIDYTQQYYPDLINNFNDASIFSVLLDLNAAIGDNLHFHIDRSIQETVLQYAQQKSSIFNIARTYGLKIPGNRPSISLLDVSITVPAFGDKEDSRYLGVIRTGSQFIGGGQIFENVNDIDFSSQYNSQGFPNIKKIPNLDTNGRITSYTITKREVVVNGSTKIFKRTINSTDVKPFFEFFLPERNVLSISGIIQKDGTNYTTPPTYDEFITSPDLWYEVDALAESKVFIEDVTKKSDKPGIKVGKYIETNNRFISEYTPEGYCKITFGGATTTADEQLEQFAQTGVPLRLEDYQNNIGLGLTVKPNTTIFVKYRIGGGKTSNIGVNTITQLGTINFSVNGPSESINQNVIRSLSCNNPTAAIGGDNLPSMEEVRNMVSYNFSAQKRAVTINDYNSLIQTMPSKFGSPAKVSITELDNKINIELLSYDSTGKLTNTVSNTLKQNIANYLSNYRMINDYISVGSANVIDLEFELYIVVENSENQGSIITNIVNSIDSYMSPLTNYLGKNVNISDIRRIIQGVAGVHTLSDLKVFNKVGGQYSSSETSQQYVDTSTKQIKLIDDTIFAQANQIYQIRFPEKDIKVRIKTLGSVNFS
jgi:hypothetical protein